MTNKPIAFMPFSLPSPPSLCRGKAGEKEKKKQESARSMMGREKRSRAISIYIYFFFGFFIGIPSGASAKERGVVWFGSSVLGMSEGPYRHQHCLKFRLF